MNGIDDFAQLQQYFLQGITLRMLEGLSDDDLMNMARLGWQKINEGSFNRLVMCSTCWSTVTTLTEIICWLWGCAISDWVTLKKQIEQHELRIVSLYVPTSWHKDPSQVDPITRAVITAINNMLIDLMAAMSYKDWLSRRQRQRQGIERAHSQGKYRGKQVDQERHQKDLYYRWVKK